MPVAISKAMLTTAEAYDYCGKRCVFELLVDRFGLQPAYLGQGDRTNRTKMFAVTSIDTALAALELHGGYDMNTGQSITQPYGTQKL